MVPFAIYTLKGVGAELSLLCLESWRIDLQVFFAASCLFSVVFGDVRSIKFDASRPVCLAS